MYSNCFIHFNQKDKERSFVQKSKENKFKFIRNMHCKNHLSKYVYHQNNNTMEMQMEKNGEIFANPHFYRQHTIEVLLAANNNVEDLTESN